MAGEVNDIERINSMGIAEILTLPSGYSSKCVTTITDETCNEYIASLCEAEEKKSVKLNREQKRKLKYCKRRKK